jgi:outer membrane protein OmpA-like peptidoglycan-associated protein
LSIILHCELLAQVHSLKINSTTINKYVDEKLVEKSMVVDSCYDKSLTLREIHIYHLFKTMSGRIIDSTQTGVWGYWDEFGELEYKIDYTNGAEKSVFKNYLSVNPDSFNLITNPSFESHSTIFCGYEYFDTTKVLKSTVAGMRIFDSINSDYSSCNEEYKTSNVYGWSGYVNEYAKIIDIRECANSPWFSFIIDSIKPKTGYSYADLVLGSKIDLALSKKKVAYGSYVLQNRLLFPLMKGEKYYLEFWIHHDYTSKFYSSGLKIFFTEQPYSRKDLLTLRTNPSDIEVDKMLEPDGWEKISFIFIAKNYARYMCITSKDPTEIKYSANIDWNEDIFFHYGMNEMKANYIFDDFKLVKKKNRRLNVLNVAPSMPIEKLSTSENDTSLVQFKTVELYTTNQVYSLKDVTFEFNRYNLNRKNLSELYKLAQYLIQNDEMKLEIYGHTDNTGSEEHNLELSRKRAKSVYDYLVEQGVSTNKISYFGFGSTMPKISNTNEANKTINRRVEFKILDH